MVVTLSRSLVLLATTGLLACAGESSDYAPTGAKGTTDPFGRALYQDEECGALDDPDYPDFFANAMLRDGDIGRERMWLVDGSHLWSLPMESDGLPQMQLERAFIGHGNAVAAGRDLLALALVDGGALIYPDYDLDTPIALGTTRAIDVALDQGLLAIAGGGDGIRIVDVSDPWWPTPLTTITVPGYAAGVRWQNTDGQRELYFAACSHVGRIVFDGHQPALQQISTRLSHTNAKDAHGDGNWLVAANNGAGVWFMDLPTLTRIERYDIADPEFYANSVQVVDEMAYIAAGNREILALRADYPEHMQPPPPPFPLDPVGILVDADTVYGFGNFRHVGERTVVRTNTIRTDGDEARFARGMTSWTEPLPYAEMTTRYAGAPTGVVEQMYWWTPNGGQMYESALTEPVWRALPGISYYGRMGTYAVSVTSDGYVRVFADGATEPVVVHDEPIGTGFVHSLPEDPFGHILLIIAETGSEYIYGPTEDGSWSGFHVDTQQNPSPHTSRVLAEFRTDSEPTADRSECRFTTAQERGHHSAEVINRGRTDAYRGEYTWCSRLVDPHLAGRRPDEDYGARIIHAGAVLSLWESGVTHVLRIDEGWLGLMDDRKAFTASVILWDLDGREIRRTTRMGKPVGWRLLDDEHVRLWLADGTTFTLDLIDWITFDETMAIDPTGGQE